VNTLTEILSNRGIEGKREEYAIQRQGNILFGVMDLFWGGTVDYYAALGLRTSNDKGIWQRLLLFRAISSNRGKTLDITAAGAGIPIPGTLRLSWTEQI
jgi:hypothetical protein